ncbi:unnamed protein product [Brassica rapa subsp. trilocularis]
MVGQRFVKAKETLLLEHIKQRLLLEHIKERIGW